MTTTTFFLILLFLAIIGFYYIYTQNKKADDEEELKLQLLDKVDQPASIKAYAKPEIKPEASDIIDNCAQVVINVNEEVPPSQVKALYADTPEVAAPSINQKTAKVKKLKQVAETWPFPLEKPLENVKPSVAVVSKALKTKVTKKQLKQPLTQPAKIKAPRKPKAI